MIGLVGNFLVGRHFLRFWQSRQPEPVVEVRHWLIRVRGIGSDRLLLGERVDRGVWSAFAKKCEHTALATSGRVRNLHTGIVGTLATFRHVDACAEQQQNWKRDSYETKFVLVYLRFLWRLVPLPLPPFVQKTNETKIKTNKKEYQKTPLNTHTKPN